MQGKQNLKSTQKEPGDPLSRMDEEREAGNADFEDPLAGDGSMRRSLLTRSDAYEEYQRY